MADESAHSDVRRVLVLGAYGLIGASVARRLAAEGFNVTGLGRSAATARTVVPDIAWIIRDLGELCDAEAWDDVVRDVDIVVNCAGSLQNGGRDDLDIVHFHAIKALAQACTVHGIGVVQISAVGVSSDATTAFMRTKAAGDTAVRESGCEFWILRPGVVLASTAYGGTELMRMLAAFPGVQPLACPDARMQTVSVDDVGQAVLMAVSGQLPAGTACDLVEDNPHSLRDVVAAFRGWLGFEPARFVLSVPDVLMWPLSKIADGLGLTGWRSPFRTTAVRVLKDGVTGDPTAWKALGGPDLSSLAETLAKMPARTEDRRSARMSLLAPFVLAVLFVFWFLSGVIGLISLDAAAKVLVDAGWPDQISRASVVFWAIVDIAIAAALLVRRYAGPACWAMIVVSLIYLASSTIVVPQLWLDPLGPLVKVLPGIVLALVGRAMLEAR